MDYRFWDSATLHTYIWALSIRKYYVNNYKDSLMMVRVVWRNMLENWQRVEDTFSAYKVVATN